MLQEDANHKFRFPKAEKLCSRTQIAALIAKKQSIFCYPFKCYYDCAPDANLPHQVVVSVPKRLFHHAVDRNRIKRLTREAYRLHREELFSSWTQPANLHYQLFFFYIGKELPTYQQVEEKIIDLFHRLRQTQKCVQ